MPKLINLGSKTQHVPPYVLNRQPRKTCDTCHRRRYLKYFGFSHLSPDAHKDTCKDCCVDDGVILNPGRRPRRNLDPHVKRKTCRGCGHRRLRSQFPADARQPDGLSNVCWRCRG